MDSDAPPGVWSWKLRAYLSCTNNTIAYGIHAAIGLPILTRFCRQLDQPGVTPSAFGYRQWRRCTPPEHECIISGLDDNLLLYTRSFLVKCHATLQFVYDQQRVGCPRNGELRNINVEEVFGHSRSRISATVSFLKNVTADEFNTHIIIEPTNSNFVPLSVPKRPPLENVLLERSSCLWRSAMSPLDPGEIMCMILCVLIMAGTPTHEPKENRAWHSTPMISVCI